MSKPKIGLSMLYCLAEPFGKMVKRLETAETQYIEVVDDGFHELDKRRISMLNDVAISRDIEYTVHSPFADINIASPSRPMLYAALRRLKKSIAYANALNARLWVLHPGIQTGISPFYPGTDWTQNRESICQLHKTAQEYGLEIALENVPEPFPFVMKSVEDFDRFYRETRLNMGLALDVGHANLNKQIELFFGTFGKKIEHIHASDNMGETDQHLGIGYGKIDWQQFAKTLRENAFDRTVIVESVEHVDESLRRLKQLLT